MINNFRICKNKYGWFKIQIWIPSRKIFFIKIKGKWKDSCFRIDSLKPILFETEYKAENALDSMIKNIERENDEWSPISKIKDHP